MDLLTTTLLIATGVVAGIIAAMVGGAVVIYPALIVTGVSPQLVADSNPASVIGAGRGRRGADGSTRAALLVLESDRLRAVCKGRNTRGHGAVRIGQRVDHGEMVGAGDLLVARQRHALLPGVGDRLALTQEFARFQRTDDGVEAAARRNAPEDRRYTAGLRIVEPQVFID